MRYLVGLICVLALGVMPMVGCIDDGGVGGDGGTGGMPECEDSDDCLDLDDECAIVTCVGGVCEYLLAAYGAACAESNECAVGQCAGGACDLTPVANGTACGNDKGTCQEGSCQVACTEQGIRGAIAAGGGPYTFDCGGPKTIVTNAEIVIDNDVILEGENVTLDGNEEHRVFSVLEGVTAELRGFRVTRAQLEGSGAGIWNRGTLLLARSTVSGNVASGGCFLADAGGGGGILNQGTLSLEGVTVSGNSANCLAGGIRNDAYATLTIHTSTISGNTAPASGAGIDNDEDGVVDIRWSTISGNTRETVAGIGNQSQGGFTIASSIVDDACGVEGFTTLVSDGYNIESPGDTCGFDHGTDLVNITERQLDLGELADNDGPTMTHALGAGSVAIDHIPADSCQVTEDQRAEPRPVGDGCDVGSFERQPEDP